jgi:hypothetical protein
MIQCRSSWLRTSRRDANLGQRGRALGAKQLAVFLPLALGLAGCGMLPASVREGCYRFDDGVPLFRVVGKRGYVLSKGQVKTFRIGGWHEFSRKSVEIRPAFYLPGLPAGDPRRGNTIAIPSIAYSTFDYDPEKNAFRVPVAAWGEEEVKLGRPC